MDCKSPVYGLTCNPCSTVDALLTTLYWNEKVVRSIQSGNKANRLTEDEVAIVKDWLHRFAEGQVTFTAVNEDVRVHQHLAAAERAAEAVNYFDSPESDKKREYMVGLDSYIPYIASHSSSERTPLQKARDAYILALRLIEVTEYGHMGSSQSLRRWL
tara:strand:- start:63907 stop:64380 length:474 start_codon:yes stop_codon:yes gene_type:complete